MSNSSKLFRERAIPQHGSAQFLVTVIVTQALIKRFGQEIVRRHQAQIADAIKHLGGKLK